jgi:diguanylate cyclase (GGDEF)-like protein
MLSQLSDPVRRRVRPTEIATVLSAVFLLATAVLVPDPDVRTGLLVTFALTVVYVAVWYHLLPPGTFGEARYSIAGSVVQLILVFMLATTGGVRSPWFVFYVLPVLATVFSYRPRSTATVAAVAMAGLVAVALADVTGPTDEVARELLVVLAIGFAALATMAYTLTRTMGAQRRALERQETRLRELLSVAERDAMTDPLTGAHNRRALDQVLSRAASRAARDAHPYSILLMDVDQLKAINDRGGHAAGDDALRAVAAAAMESVRGYDVVARAGGDEFVVVLHDAEAASSRATAARIAQRASDRLGADPALRGATISVGGATWKPGRSPEELIAEADTAMYEAKRQRHARR